MHTPHQDWKKDFVLLLSMGSPDNKDAEPVKDLFKYMCEILGPENKLHIIEGTRLAVSNHVVKTQEEMEELYPKMKLPVELAEVDYNRNQEVLGKCFELGRKVVKE